MTSEITLRLAHPDDAEALATVQNAIFCAGLRAGPVDADRMREIYLANPDTIQVTIAEQDGAVAGFQFLGLAREGNQYGVPLGWGMVGTHIRPESGRSGIGRRLFAETLRAARRAGPAHLDASIGADNQGGLAYYKAMGFRPYREFEGRIPHRLDL
ncbi:GNAT family N-acetyltransferase [Paracoccus aerodenitrificans]|uniref:GNAT family N-acetyltransferase n=1 Tax=Paracoccus aerodenitrificans TaxID=3017781 RepID=UPI0022F0412A|nr:GNAT family N-acetyltransferase [Paracoccus aerodenitrificans]WBU64333.1 GNAT family N-acetyltransferase [Paracoccus aerodenitrificans]